MNAEPLDDEVERRLTALEEASDRRRAELTAVLHDLPAAVSRREVISSAFRDLRSDAGNGSMLRGMFRTIARAPGRLMDRLRARRAP